MKRTLLYNLFFLFSITIHAQSTLISGKIIVDDADEVINLDGFVIENSTTSARTKANEKGLFSIKVNEGDQLIFKQIGIIERQIKISKNMINKGFIDVHVNIEVIELAETNIAKLNKDMLNNLGKEKSLQEKLNDKMDISSIDFKASLNLNHEDAKVRRTISQVGGVNLLGLFNIFKNPVKRLKKIKKIEKPKQEILLDLQKFYTINYFVNDLKIPQGKIIDFLDYCYSNFNFYQLLEENNYDEILFIIEEQAPIYLNKINSKPSLND